jgi:succinoglycan biosynthesis transport protein ExoP
MQQVVTSEYGLEAIPRREYGVEDYIEIAKRNWQWLVGPLLTGLTLATIAAFFWPDTYISSAAIRVVPPQVPERYVPTNVNVQMGDRVRAMAQSILSRNTLTNIIQTYDLYRKDLNRIPMEDVIENMRKAIQIGNLRSLPGRQTEGTFAISFSYENRYVAQKVTRDLMTRFIDENIRERSSQSQLTTQFLREQWEESKRQLESVEQRVTAFRIANQGRLPEHVTMNMGQMSGLEARLTALNAAVSRANQEKLAIEGQIRALREKMTAIASRPVQMPSSGATSGEPAQEGAPVDRTLELMNTQIAQLERALEQMLEVYKENYPDVQRIKTRIASLKRERENYMATKLVAPALGGAPGAPGQPDRPVVAARPAILIEIDAEIARLQGQLRARELEAENGLREIAEVERRQKEVQSRLDSGPVGIQEYELMLRDRELIKSRYDELNKKLNDSTVATELEGRKQGETLEVLDLPSLPESPTAPNRTAIILAGMVIGLALGVGLVVFREAKDSSLKSLKDVRAYTRFAILGSFPLLENDLVIRRRKRISWIGWSTAILLALALVSFSIYYYYSTRV